MTAHSPPHAQDEPTEPDLFATDDEYTLSPRDFLRGSIYVLAVLLLSWACAEITGCAFEIARAWAWGAP